MNNIEIRCLVCDHVFKKERPVLCVSYFSDGEIQCDCNDISHYEGNDVYKGFHVVGINHLIENDVTIKSAFPLKKGYYYVRENVNQGWVEHQLDEEENSI